MKTIKLILLTVSLLILTGCGSVRFSFNSQPIATGQQINQPVVKTYTTTHQTFANLDPWDLGLSFGGNWVHCRTHGFHDLNDWTDFSFSPYFCRPTHGFLSGSQWNSNWGGMNRWNPRFNYLGNTPYRWSPFGYDRWGYNMHYGWNNHGWGYNGYYGNGWNNYGWNNYGWNNYGQNNWYGRRGRNNGSYINGRRGSSMNIRDRVGQGAMIESSKRDRVRVRTNTTPTRVIRTNTTPTRVIRTKPIRTNTTPIRPVIRNNSRPVRNNNSNSTIRNNSRPVRNNSSSVRTNTKPVSRPTTTTRRRNN